MKLHGYFRSSAAFRVRIALNLKGLAYEDAFVHLRKGDQRGAEYLGLNPQALVPTLEDGRTHSPNRSPSSNTWTRRIPRRRCCRNRRRIARGYGRWPRSSPATSTRSTICGSFNTCSAS